jgi:hypothetical protein
MVEKIVFNEDVYAEDKILVNTDTDAYHYVGGTIRTVNVLDFGADRTGNTDCAEPFRKAIAAVARAEATSSEGGIVFVPPGRYKIYDQNGPYLPWIVSVQTGVTLQGTSRYLPTLTSSDYTTDGGTIIEMYNTDTSAYLFYMQRASAIKGITIYYPDQAVEGTPDTPSYTEYGWSIIGASGSIHIEDINLVNSYKGIRLYGDSSGFRIRTIQGEALHTGIEIDDMFDYGIMENIAFHRSWTSVKYADWRTETYITDLYKSRKFAYNTSIALKLHQADWFIINNFACYGYRVGIMIEDPNIINGQITNINLDAGDYGIYLNNTNDWKSGIIISNYNYATLADTTNYNAQNKIGIAGDSGNKNTLIVRGGSFWGPYIDAISWNCNEATLIVTNSSFKYWGYGVNQRAIFAANSSTNCINISNCVFESGLSAGSTAIECGVNTKEIVVGNFLNGGTTSEIASKWDQNEW